MTVILKDSNRNEEEQYQSDTINESSEKKIFIVFPDEFIQFTDKALVIAAHCFL
jgi:hypothetical protein